MFRLCFAIFIALVLTSLLTAQQLGEEFIVQFGYGGSLTPKSIPKLEWITVEGKTVCTPPWLVGTANCCPHFRFRVPPNARFRLRLWVDGVVVKHEGSHAPTPQSQWDKVDDEKVFTSSPKTQYYIIEKWIPLTNPSIQEARLPLTRHQRELLSRLGSDSFREREAATAELRRLGRQAAATIETGLTSTDPEVRQRCRAVKKEWK